MTKSSRNLNLTETLSREVQVMLLDGKRERISQSKSSKRKRRKELKRKQNRSKKNHFSTSLSISKLIVMKSVKMRKTIKMLRIWNSSTKWQMLSMRKLSPNLLNFTSESQKFLITLATEKKPVVMDWSKESAVIDG